MNDFEKELKELEPIKISVKKQIYYVNEKKKTVGCRIWFSVNGPDCVLTALDWFSDKFNWDITAEAHLNPVDNFDVEIGKKVARAKAESMAYTYVSKIFEDITFKMYKAVNSFMKFGEKANGVIEHNERYLKSF